MLDHSFLKGLTVGVLTPVLFLRSLIQIVYHATGQVLFVEKQDANLSIVLLNPEEAANRAQDATLSLAATARGLQVFVQSLVSGASSGTLGDQATGPKDIII